MSIHAYKEKAPDNTKENASAFTMAKDKAKINCFKTNFPDSFDKGMNEEVEKCTIYYQMARMMQPGLDMERQTNHGPGPL
jgi:hypothetical protein